MADQDDSLPSKTSSLKHALKENFEPQSKYEAFYTGGNVQLSQDGTHLFCCCGYKVTVVQTETGKVVHAFGKEEDEDDVTSFTLSNDDSILIIAGRRGLLRQWDWRNETITRTWKSLHTRPVKCMAFDSTSTLLATGGSDATLKVWDIVRQYCTHNFKGAQGVFSTVMFHPDVQRLLLLGAADDCKIHVWSLATSKSTAVLEGHFSPVTQITFSKDGDSMISCGRDKVILVWDFKQFILKSTIPAFEAIESMFLLPENRAFPNLNVKKDDLHIITGGSKGVLRVFNLRTATAVFTQNDSPVAALETDDLEIARINSIAFNEKLDSLTVITHDHNILFYKLDNFKLWKQFIGYNNEILDICFMGSEDTHIAVATNSPNIKLFELATFNCQMLEGHRDIVMSVRSFPNQQTRMISGSKDKTVRLWELDVESNEITCLFVGSGHTQAVNAVACSNLNGKFVLSGSHDTTLKLWDIPTKLTLVVSVPSLVSRCTEKAHDKEINSIAVAPNDKLIATASHDKTAKIWKSENLDLYGTLRGHRRGIWSIQFSTIDQVIATSSADGTVKIWALNTFACLKTFEGHESSVLRVNFLSRGMQLLTTASDGNMKLWTVKQNECVKTKEAHSGKVWALAVSRDEKIYVTGGADSTIILWKDTTEIEKEEAKTKIDTLIIQEQKLSNLIQKRKWVKALKLAIHLEQPFRALTLIKEIMLEPEKSDLKELIEKLRVDQIISILKFANTWNTNSKHCAAAQLIVKAILNCYTPEELLEFPTIKEHLEGLLPYTERHFQRMNRLQQQATFVDYMWKTMTLGDPITTDTISTQKTTAKPETIFFVDTIASNTIVADPPNQTTEPKRSKLLPAKRKSDFSRNVTETIVI